MPPPRTVRPAATVRRGTPDFINAMNDDYLAQVSHTFILHGNIDDFVDNAGNELSIYKVLAAFLDDHINRSVNPNATTNHQDTGVQRSQRVSEKQKIVAFYNTSQGLEFPDSSSKEIWMEMFKTIRGDTWLEAQGPLFFDPRSAEGCFKLMNEWFKISKQVKGDNKIARDQNQPLRKELVMSIIFTDADALFPAGDIANLTMDRQAIVTIRNWARDKGIGAGNRIILLTKYLEDIHQSIRSELAVSHPVRKPNLQDRTEWLTNFSENIKIMARNQPLVMGDNQNVTQVDLAPEFSLQEFAIQSAGINRRQIKDVILDSWRRMQPVDFSIVQERKKRVLYDEFGGWLEIVEPKFGFEQIGGHEHFKDYFQYEVVKPLKAGNKRMCSQGALMLGPPGTGKTMVALAGAKEGGLNFLRIDLGMVFGGVVGESEKNTRRLIEAIDAASPCVAFFDEVDQALSGGRSSGGDSGTSARVFQYLMTWLSDPARAGKVVVLFASNRPDLLDSALIREGRIDAKIPLLPPAKDDAVGRWDILRAQTIKHRITLSQDLQGTRSVPGMGLGNMLLDQNRYWTGAEIEAVLKSALRRASRAERSKGDKQDFTIQMSDWDFACARAGRTGEVERQIDLALEYSKLEYVPEEWIERAELVQHQAEERRNKVAYAA